jgi:hypothetical protein
MTENKIICANCLEELLIEEIGLLQRIKFTDLYNDEDAAEDTLLISNEICPHCFKSLLFVDV